jgi:hypothetical protein
MEFPINTWTTLIAVETFERDETEGKSTMQQHGLLMNRI